MAAPKLRTPRDAILAAAPEPANALELSTARFLTEVRAMQAENARLLNEAAAERAMRGASRAIEAACAELRDHARRWAQARRDALAEIDCTAAPVRDRGLNLKGFIA